MNEWKKCLINTENNNNQKKENFCVKKLVCVNSFGQLKLFFAGSIFYCSAAGSFSH